jgi:transposase
MMFAYSINIKQTTPHINYQKLYEQLRASSKHTIDALRKDNKEKSWLIQSLQSQIASDRILLQSQQLQIESLQSQLQWQQSANESQQLLIQNLQLQVREINKIAFGNKREKFISPLTAAGVLQLDLFPDDKLGEMEVVKTTLIKTFEKKQTKLKVKHPGRHPLPDHLRREIVPLHPEGDVSNMQYIGDVIKEVLEYREGEMYVTRYVRPEYIKPSEDGLSAERVIAPLPALPLPKSIAGASVLSHLMVSKFIDHLPIYRQLSIFKRQGVEIKEGTIYGWIKDAMELIYPVYDLHCKAVLNTNYLNVDETTIKVLDEHKKGTTHQGYFWVYYDTQTKLAIYDYQPGRGAIYPQSMLHNFKGYLQSDGYDAYETFDKIEGITTLCCWAHARRKFYDAQSYDIANTEKILTLIQELYKTEDYCRAQNFIPEQIRNHRQQYSVPVLNTLERLLKTLMATAVLPKSPLGKAINYTLNRWNKLCIYTTNGILQIDNNLVENSIRPVALGRKNFLFAGSHERAQDAAMMYSLFATCRLHNINPAKWLTYLFTNVNSTPKEQLHLLLPQNYAAAGKEK